MLTKQFLKLYPTIHVLEAATKEAMKYMDRASNKCGVVTDVGVAPRTWELTRGCFYVLGLLGFNASK